RGTVILPDHLVEFLRPQLVGKRPWRVLVEPRGSKETGATGLRADSHRTIAPSSAEHGGDFLSVANDHDAPSAVLRLAQALEIAGPGNAFAIDLLDHVAALGAQIAGVGTVIYVDDDHALVSIAHLELVDERRRKIGDLDARKRRTRVNHDLLARHFRRNLQRNRHGLLASAPHDATPRGDAQQL